MKNYWIVAFFIAVFSTGAQAANWQELTTCQGWNLCLENLAAARSTDYETAKDPYRFPYRADLGVVSRVGYLTVSPNCKGHLEVDQGRNLICAPFGNRTEAFVVARPVRTAVDDLQTLDYITFNFQEAGRAKLFKDPSVGGYGSYYLQIQ